ncbi:hypothetical protein AB685_14890 [Bacillus sp. LL01]|uniref:hypothetical protein n=1 Tax=Bacillus sp. LL01 TaxID=1665556 RepID=UPI00064D2FD9|nr:hypothetical protein [Bacillus sp. LL01]KMJ58090.1 hypothetical protein AB685_14890 [Bacillus sp. LL01]
MSKKYYNHIYEGGFVRYENEVALYTITGHAKKKDRESWMPAAHTYADYKVTSASLDVFRAIFQHRNTNKEHRHYHKAWPSQRRLQVELVMADKTLAKHIAVLENVGLLKVDRLYRNNRPFHVYSFPKPATVGEFKAKFPIACREYERKMSALDAIRGEEQALESELVDWF